MARTSSASLATRSPVQNAALAVGSVFLLIGILGFVPGITQNFDTITFADHESEAKLLGLFQVNILHNIVHLLFGVVGLAMARTATNARNFLIWGGVVYLVLWIYGMVVDLDSSANFVSLNDADNWLHLALGAGMIGLGAVLGSKRGRT